MAEQFALMTLLAKIEAEDKLLKRAEETHREKSKAYLEDIKKCVHRPAEQDAVRRRQLRDFNAWFDDWGIGFPSCEAEANDERAAFLKMGMDNPYYLDWVKRITTWEPVVLDPFCHACALWHGKVSWCKGCEE